MANPQKNKGDRAEREVASILSDELGLPVKRALGAGRKEDVGDIFGIPDVALQVVAYKDIARASASVGNLIDSYVFLVLAFPAFWHSLYAGNVIGKFEMIVVGVALTLMRRRWVPVSA